MADAAAAANTQRSVRFHGARVKELRRLHDHTRVGRPGTGVTWIRVPSCGLRHTGARPSQPSPAKRSDGALDRGNSPWPAAPRRWGADLYGYPGIDLDPDGPTVAVQLFESPDLPEHWTRLDEFEGSGYRRTVTTVNTTGARYWHPSTYWPSSDPHPSAPRIRSLFGTGCLAIGVQFVTGSGSIR